MVFKKMFIFAITVNCIPTLVDAKQNQACSEAKAVYSANRKEQRSGYNFSRGIWLNCVEHKANEAKRKYCRLKPTSEHHNVKTEIFQACKEEGISEH